MTVKTKEALAAELKRGRFCGMMAPMDGEPKPVLCMTDTGERVSKVAFNYLKDRNAVVPAGVDIGGEASAWTILPNWQFPTGRLSRRSRMPK